MNDLFYPVSTIEAIAWVLGSLGLIISLIVGFVCLRYSRRDRE